jgi:hypothetical protein
MACIRRAKACAVTERAPQDGPVSPTDRRSHPNSDSTASLLGNADAGHCTRQGCTRPYPGCRYAHQLLDWEDYGEELEMEDSISLEEQLLQAGPTCRGPSQCKRSPWTIKGRGHSLERRFWTHTRTQTKEHPCSHNQYNTKVDVGYYALAARTTLKSSRPSCVHPHIDPALLSLLQTHPWLGLGGCFPPPGWRIPPTASSYTIYYVKRHSYSRSKCYNFLWRTFIYLLS